MWLVIQILGKFLCMDILWGMQFGLYQNFAA